MSLRTLSLAALVLACKPHGVNLCPNFEVAADEAEEVEKPGPEMWYSGMIPTMNTGSMLPPAELRDCREQRVVSPKNHCDDTTPPAQRLPDRKLTAEDIVLTRRAGNEFLLWTEAHHFDDGTALGPVAVARWTKRGVRISALGSLRAAARHARLRLEPLGDGLVLIAEGSACRGDDKCIPLTRIVPLVGEHFVDTAMRLAEGGCGGPATFPLVGGIDVTLGPAKLRQFRLQRNIVIKDGVGVIHEEVVATDFDPQQKDVPGVEFRRHSKSRELLLDKDGLIIQRGVWDDFIAEHGSVRPSDHDGS